MKCKFCSNASTSYCKTCNAPLCDKHVKRGRNRVIYCSKCNSEFYKPLLAFLKSVKIYCAQEDIHGDHIYEIKAELHKYIDKYV